ncbi:class II aldolase/adducin family protein [Streptomyces sp. NPDC014636]|uniref:class II aldolase/adducin family protein n=1 Tax=Streptomyces sp. NPDC014636 TaxID=3364876 RepID=UPI00370007F9
MAEPRRNTADGRQDARQDGPRDAQQDAQQNGRQDVARLWTHLIDTARRTVTEGLVVGTSGNVSARIGDLVLVTPSGVPYDRLTPADLTGVDLGGRQVLGTLVPTSELPMHLAVYRSTDARAVVHTHAVHATAVSTLVPELPLVHYMAAALGGPVRVAPYATYGTDELAANMLGALAGRTGCLLQNHGTVTYGATLDQAYDRTAQLEWMCRLWLTASSVPGLTPTLLNDAQLAEVGERLKGYGQRR